MKKIIYIIGVIFIFTLVLTSCDPYWHNNDWKCHICGTWNDWNNNYCWYCHYSY